MRRIRCERSASVRRMSFFFGFAETLVDITAAVTK
jgi:hypothetical protein